jgi:hypothetical protein
MTTRAGGWLAAVAPLVLLSVAGCLASLCGDEGWELWPDAVSLGFLLQPVSDNASNTMTAGNKRSLVLMLPPLNQ